MKKYLDLIDEHHAFIKEQAEMYALSSALAAGSFMCFKYMDNLLYIPGLLSVIFLATAAVGLALRNINRAQSYIKKAFGLESKLAFTIFGLAYVSTVASLSLAILFESSGV